MRRVLLGCAQGLALSGSVVLLFSPAGITLTAMVTGDPLLAVIARVVIMAVTAAGFVRGWFIPRLSVWVMDTEIEFWIGGVISVVCGVVFLFTVRASVLGIASGTGSDVGTWMFLVVYLPYAIAATVAALRP